MWLELGLESIAATGGGGGGVSYSKVIPLCPAAVGRGRGRPHPPTRGWLPQRQPPPPTTPRLGPVGLVRSHNRTHPVHTASAHQIPTARVGRPTLMHNQSVPISDPPPRRDGHHSNIGGPLLTHSSQPTRGPPKHTSAAAHHSPSSGPPALGPIIKPNVCYYFGTARAGHGGEGSHWVALGRTGSHWVALGRTGTH